MILEYKQSDIVKMKRKLQSLFLFLVVGLLSSGRTGFSSEICGENPIPGSIDMKKGYDITTYTIHEHQEPANMKEDIFKYTCNLNRSIYPDSSDFTYPDQFIPIASGGFLHSTNHATIIDHFQHFIKIQRSWIKTIHWKALDFFEKLGRNATKGQPELEKIGEAVGAIGKLVIPPQKSTLEEYALFVRNREIHAKINLVRSSIYPLEFENPEHLLLRDDFIKAYNTLPASFLKNPEPFLDFISRFGTHYMHETEFGGRLIYKMKHICRYSCSMDGRNRKDEIKNEFEIMSNNNNYYNPTREDARSYVEVRSEVIGGNLSIPVLPYNSYNHQKWVYSVFWTPSLIEVSFVPIARLIANESISFQVAQAVVYKVKKETLEKYNDLMKIIEPKHYPNTTTHDVKRLELKKDYERQYNELKESLTIPPKDKGPKHLVDIITKNTTEIESEVNSLTKSFENSFDPKEN